MRRDDLIDGVLLAIGEHGDDLAAAGLGNRGEDVGGMGRSRHGVKIYIPITEYVKR